MPTESLDGMRERGWVLPASLARGDDAVPSWTRIGVLDSPTRAVVDPRGMVSPWGPEGPSLDWCVGAEDRWHVPARDPGVSQARVDSAPVVETELRVPGGTVVHRAFVTLAGGAPWVVVEVENRSAVPVALAWSVRPFSPTRTVPLAAIGLRPLRGGTGGPSAHAIEVRSPGDPRPVTFGLFGRAPSRWSHHDDGTDPLGDITSGGAELWPSASPSSPSPSPEPPAAGATPGTGSSPNVLPRGHEPTEASVAFVVPLPHTATARLLLTTDPARAEVVWPGEVPGGEQVVRGWSALAGRGPRVELPDPVLAGAVAASRRSLPLFTGPDAERMEIAAALSLWGCHDLAAAALTSWPAEQVQGGGFGSVAATARALVALSRQAVAAGDFAAAGDWLPEVGAAITFLGRAARRRGGSADAAPVAAGLDAGAVLMAGLGQSEAASRIARDVSRMRAVASRAAAASGRSAPMAAALAASGSGPSGPDATARAVAGAVLAAGDPEVTAEALWALLRQASATGTWPDPHRWVGEDGLVHARMLEAVARLLVEDGPDGVGLAPRIPAAWRGQSVEVHGLPTRWGRVSYALRWHGPRPALLWDLGDPVPGQGEPPALTSPALDPAWRATGRTGEALLAEISVPAETTAAGVGADSARMRGDAVAAAPRSVWRIPAPDPRSPTADPPTADPPTADPPTGDRTAGGGSFS